MTTRALPRQFTDAPQRPALTLWGEVSLPRGRAHEICGGARRTLAMLVAAATEGPVLWIQPAWRPDRLNGEAMTAIADPGRFLFAYIRRPEDLLWSTEEALRSGAAGLVVTDLTEPPGLTPVRRLHLAAETGSGQGKGRPLALLLTPGEGGAQGIETRWKMVADHAPGAGWLLTRARARSEPPRTWRLGAAQGKMALAAA